MLTDQQQPLSLIVFYQYFNRSEHNNENQYSKTELPVGLAAYAMNSSTFSDYYFKQTKKANNTRGKLNKIPAVAAGQKRLQTAVVFSKYKIDLDDYE